MKHGLYVHVPFCERKCKYCDFYSLPVSGESLPRKFLDVLDQEMASLPSEFRPQTIYIGGGTPTSLPSALLKELLALMGRYVDTKAVEEWTCEVNPGTITEDKADVLLGGGVNRISLGAQSFNDSSLSLLGRIHTADDTRVSFDLLRRSGFDNISLDLMYAIPEADRRQVETDLAVLLEMDPQHLSTYCLTIEEHTPMYDLRALGRIEEWDDEEQLAQYDLIRETLAGAGYHHYEISNFAKPGFECRHNRLYWGADSYIGCGPAAHSHWNGVRYGNPDDLHLYCRRIAEGRSAREAGERLEPEAKAREILVMGLRQLDGVSRSEFRNATGFDYRDLRGREIDTLCADGLLIEEGERLRLSDEALFISNSVFAELV